MFKHQHKGELHHVCLPQSLTLGKLRVTLSVFRGPASLPVETRHRDKRDGIYLGFGCNPQQGARPKCTTWAGHWNVLPHPGRKMQRLAPCHRCRSPERSAECYIPKAFPFPYQRCTYTKRRGTSHEHFFTHIYRLNFLMQCLNRESKGWYQKGFNISRTREARAGRRSKAIYGFSGSVSVI